MKIAMNVIRSYFNYLKKRRHKKLLRLYMERGCIPWSQGYDEHKWNSLCEEFLHDDFYNRLAKEGYGFRLDERIVEYPWFFSALPTSSGNLLDAGGALNHLSLIEHPKMLNKKTTIVTLAPEGTCFCKKGVSYLYHDLRSPIFLDNTFDFICSISTLEHVGLDNTFLYSKNTAFKEDSTTDYLHFLLQLKKILKQNGTLYLTIPFGIARNHKWLQVFDSIMVDRVINHFSPIRYTETIFRYNNDRWMLSDREQSAHDDYFDIHATSNFPNDFLAAARSVVCLELIKA